MNSFERLTKARTATGEAVKAYALARHELDQIHADRKASSEDVYERAQQAREAEARLNEAIQAECAAVIAADEGSE